MFRVESETSGIFRRNFLSVLRRYGDKLSSSCFDGFMKGVQAPDSIKGLSAVISGCILF